MIDVASVTLAALDHGFYFDDESMPIVAAPIRNVGREWRFVVVGTDVIAGSAYDAATRSAVSHQPGSDAWAYAQSVASELASPAEAYVLDVCECDGKLRLMEINPFGGTTFTHAIPSRWCGLSLKSILVDDRNAWKDAVAKSDARLEWDPDHAADGAKLGWRAVQFGLRGDALRRYSRDWIVSITDISEFVREQRAISVPSRDEQLLVPRERVYAVSDVQTIQNLRLDSAT